MATGWKELVVIFLSFGTVIFSQHVNMDNPHGIDYCPKPKDPRHVMSYAFKEQVCHTYLHWCKNLEMKPEEFIPTKPQKDWWSILGVQDSLRYSRKGSRKGRSRKRGKRQARRRRLRKSTRKDYLSMTDGERSRFHRAVQRLKETYVDGRSMYDIFVGYHQAYNAPGAHFGPGFMTWHREYLLRFENALREIDPSVNLPYWNSNADDVLGDLATETIIWTPEFAGNGDGLVTSGPFANWPMPFESNGNRRLYRGLNDFSDRRGRAPRLFHDGAMRSIVEASTYRDITWNVDGAYESSHGATHNWIGGVMRDLPNSPSDPMFFLHHSFLDCLFERMLQRQKARGVDVRYSYPNDTEALGVGTRQTNGVIARRPEESLQYSLAPMSPFEPLRNIDGLRPEYTEMYYSCAPVATCTSRNLDCGSKNLFCETALFKCAPRLKIGTPCGNFSVGRREEEANPCYQSICCNGVCANHCDDIIHRRNPAESRVNELSLEDIESSIVPRSRESIEELDSPPPRSQSPSRRPIPRYFHPLRQSSEEVSGEEVDLPPPRSQPPTRRPRPRGFHPLQQSSAERSNEELNSAVRPRSPLSSTRSRPRYIHIPQQSLEDVRRRPSFEQSEQRRIQRRRPSRRVSDNVDPITTRFSPRGTLPEDRSVNRERSNQMEFSEIPSRIPTRIFGPSGSNDIRDFDRTHERLRTQPQRRFEDFPPNETTEREEPSPFDRGFFRFGNGLFSDQLNDPFFPDFGFTPRFPGQPQNRRSIFRTFAF